MTLVYITLGLIAVALIYYIARRSKSHKYTYSKDTPRERDE